MSPMLWLAVAVAVMAAVRGLWSPCGLSMLSSLNPVSESARGHRFALTAAWYLLGATVGGALLGGVCAGLAGLVRLLPGDVSWRWAVVVAAALLTAASDSTLVRFTLPVHPRQVDERWLGRYRRWIYAGGFGLQIGTGFATYVMSGTVYLTTVLAVLTASPAAALLVGVTFGVVRGLGILVAAHARDAGALRRLLAAVERRGPLSLRVTCAVSLTGGAVALVPAVHHPLALVLAIAAGAVALFFGAWTSRPPSCSAPGRSNAGSTTVGSGVSAGSAARSSSSLTATPFAGSSTASSGGTAAISR